MNFEIYPTLIDACNAIQDQKDAGSINEKTWIDLLGKAHDFYNPRLSLRSPKMIEGSWNPLQAKEDGTLVIPDGFQIRYLPSAGGLAKKKNSNRIEPLEVRLFAITQDAEVIEKVYKASSTYNPFAYNRHPGDDPMYMATIEGRRIIAEGGEAYIQKRIGEGNSKGNKSVLTISLKDHIALTPQQTHDVGVKFTKLLSKKNVSVKVKEAPKGKKIVYSLEQLYYCTNELVECNLPKVIWEPNLVLRKYIQDKNPGCTLVENWDDIPAGCILISGSIPNLDKIAHIHSLIHYPISWRVSEFYTRLIDANDNVQYIKKYDVRNRKYIGLNESNLWMIQEPEYYKIISTEVEGYLWTCPKTGNDIRHFITDKSKDKNSSFTILTQDGKKHIVEKEPLPPILGNKDPETNKYQVLVSGLRRRAEQLVTSHQTGPDGSTSAVYVDYKEDKSDEVTRIWRSDELLCMKEDDRDSIISRWTDEQPLTTQEWEELDPINRRRRTRRELGKKKQMFVLNKKTSSNSSKWVQRARNSKHGYTYDKAQRAQAWSAFSRN